MKICCPECGSTKNKKNGHIHNGKQNHISMEILKLLGPTLEVIEGDKQEWEIEI